MASVTPVPVPRRFLKGLALFWLLVIAASFLHAANPVVWILENLPTIIACLWLWITSKSRPLSRTGYLLCTAFLVLHEIGAHYTYGRVPAGAWMALQFHFTRNYYDRCVHFAFGLLISYPLWESFRRNMRNSVLPLYLLVLAIVMWFGALYEIAEALALMLAPDAGAVFLAQQGDPFDSQNDMACAMLGSLIALSFIALARMRRQT
jgi:putative membrane protein